jgi:hypothetical protein
MTDETVKRIEQAKAYLRERGIYEPLVAIGCGWARPPQRIEVTREMSLLQETLLNVRRSRPW